MLLLITYTRLPLASLSGFQRWLAPDFHGREHTAIDSTYHRSACRRILPSSQQTIGHFQSTSAQAFQDRSCRGVLCTPVAPLCLQTLTARPLAVLPCRLRFDRATFAVQLLSVIRLQHLRVGKRQTYQYRGM